MSSNRRRIVCEWHGGNRTVTPWYDDNDDRLHQFFAQTDRMVWLRVEREQQEEGQQA